MVDSEEDSVENSMSSVKRQHTSASFSMLNDHCLLEIYKYLGLDDFINLSRTCKHLKKIANIFNRIYSDFKINVYMNNKQQDYIEHVISNINTTVAEILIDYKNSEVPMNVRKMSKCCGVDVKNLQISNWTVDVTESEYHRFNNLEILTMADCDFRRVLSCFFELFSGLKAVNLLGFRNLPNTIFLEKLFRKNPTIESFVWMGDVKAFEEFELFGMIPNITALSLKVDGTINDYDFGTTFINLTKLQLHCNGESISEFLHALATSTEIPVLKEMELLRVHVDDLFFYALYYFRRLELLAISTWSYWKLVLPLDWPETIKHLRLNSFIISMAGFMSTIRQLKYLERFDIESCTIANEDRHFFQSFEELPKVITAALEDDKGKRTDFVLNARGDDSNCVR